jgi:glutamate formiminotransferase / formiminotetrahydrofolate cyclodeaminase
LPKLVECVPNFSEGRRPEVVDAIRDAIASVSGVSVLDASSDSSHNRSVITFVAPMESAVEAAFAGIRTALQRIDLTKHQGEHPRIGAADVVPFVPLEGTTIDDCISLARELGARVGKELEIPVYLYERAASRPSRQNLADVRRGQFEGLRQEIGVNAERDPDFGPARIHPTFGAVAIGARPFLVAYNIYLGGAENLQIAKDIAKAVRGSSGGFPYVKALGLEVDGQAQVSMNLVDTEKTPLHVVFDAVNEKAGAAGIEVTWSEIIGLVPERVLFDCAASHLKLTHFTADQVLERKVQQASQGGDSVGAFVASVASSEPVPGGGSVAAHAGALAAALAQMVASLTIGKKKYTAVDAEMRDIVWKAEKLAAKLSTLVQSDADAYAAVAAAYKLPKDGDDATASRADSIRKALLAAAKIPLETCRACRSVVELARTAAASGNTNAITDAGVCALLAEAGCRGASYNVRINVVSLDDRSKGAALADEAQTLVKETAAIAAEVSATVEKALG